MMKIKAVLFDWAGTTVDFGCCGPIKVLLAAFQRHGIEVSEAEARGPMGLLKKDHIAALLRVPRIAAAWSRSHGQEPSDLDLEAVHDIFLALQKDSLVQYADVIPGVALCVDFLRQHGIRIGSTTGYTSEMLAPVARIASEQGYAPDAIVTPDQVGLGRPYPFMILENLVRLHVWPPSVVVKVGDTPVDIAEGLNAGVWTLGVAGTGNDIGMTADAFALLPEEERSARLQASRCRLEEAGAHFTVDSLTEIPALIDRINKFLDASPGTLSVPRHLQDTYQMSR